MKWWLTVFFLVGNNWVSGDSIYGWNSRPYATRVQCEERRTFAEEQTRRYPLDLKAVWVCNEGKPARRPPPPGLEVDRSPSLVQSPGTAGQPADAGAPGAAALHSGLRIFTHETEPWIKEDAIGLRFTGPLTAPLADDLRRLLLGGKPVYNHVVLELDSPGGELGEVGKIVEVLAQVRKRAMLVTRVMGAQMCASGCVAVFMQGTKRKASGASVWVFHGACSAGSNIPSAADTEKYLALLESSGVSPAFLCELREKGYVNKPGNLFLSGYELFNARNAGIITELLPSWQPEDPILPRAYEPR